MELIRGIKNMYDEMNGLQVLWYLLTNWEEGKGLWLFIGLGVIAFIFSIISDKYLDDKDVPVRPQDQYPY